MAGRNTDNRANSVQLQLQLPAGTELGKRMHYQCQLVQALVVYYGCYELLCSDNFQHCNLTDELGFSE